MRPDRTLGLVDRLGLARYTVLLTAIGVGASSAICALTYWLIGFDPMSTPISLVLPVLCPLLIIPPMVVRGTKAAMKLREQQDYIAAQNDALERSLIEKERIISLVGHDLRGHLNLVMGFAQLISRQADGIPTERLVDYANEIHQAGKKTNEVLTDLLNWSRARRGQLTAGQQSSPFAEVLTDVIEDLESDAARKEILIKIFSPIPEDAVDPVVSASALRNILSNAIKFSHPGDEIDIEIQRNDDEIRVRITDNGIGMNQEQLARLRGGYLVSSTEGTSGETGTGLGLAICRDVIEAQGGRLEIESTPGRGTTVTMTFPLQG